ncbi:hypothetical protein AALP_AA2G247400 [Arabis alpina]|uniref:Uncharacterized protein n=1 Tax=Arabis alpina TaxID=50452 RepID=A0A087HJS1_ARAAL|nr:hypothetical protein AALP_AA2G247400 [Arabis alpina]
MKCFIVFMLANAMYFGLNEACRLNHMVIENDLGRDGPLQFHCRGWNGQDSKVQTLNNNGAKYSLEIIDVTNYRERTKWNCMLRFGPAKEFFYDIEVYRAAANPRCGQLRHWVARKDGIYFRKSVDMPLGRVLSWKK